MKLQLVEGIKITEGRKLHLRMFIKEDTKVMRVSLYYKTTIYNNILLRECSYCLLEKQQKMISIKNIVANNK